MSPEQKKVAGDVCFFLREGEKDVDAIAAVAGCSAGTVYKYRRMLFPETARTYRKHRKPLHNHKHRYKYKCCLYPFNNQQSLLILHLNLHPRLDSLAKLRSCLIRLPKKNQLLLYRCFQFRH